MSVRRYILVAAVATAFGVGGCGGGEHARGSENPELDEMTMSLRFDREDLEKLYETNVDKLMESRVMEQWERQTRDEKPPVVAVFPIRNETSEHIRGALDALLSKLETDLVNESPVDVVAYDRQSELMQEIRRQQAGAYDPRRLAEQGKQLGAQYFVTGKVYDVAERTAGERRVQYFLFIQVLEVSTGAIKFQTEAGISKALLG